MPQAGHHDTPSRARHCPRTFLEHVRRPHPHGACTRGAAGQLGVALMVVDGAAGARGAADVGFVVWLWGRTARRKYWARAATPVPFMPALGPEQSKRTWQHLLPHLPLCPSPTPSNTPGHSNPVCFQLRLKTRQGCDSESPVNLALRLFPACEQGPGTESPPRHGCCMLALGR